MKIYLLSLGAGLLAGVLYSLLGVRSPAPPAVALVGLLGILLGEQILPVAKRVVGQAPVLGYLRTDCAQAVLGHPIGEAGSTDRQE